MAGRFLVGTGMIRYLRYIFRCLIKNAELLIYTSKMSLLTDHHIQETLRPRDPRIQLPTFNTKF
jgi:hypothetical protein